MTDRRNPVLLGSEILRLRHSFEKRPLHVLVDVHQAALHATPRYYDEDGPIEKYGDPTKLPSTLPN
jgi:hypothetical protein